MSDNLTEQQALDILRKVCYEEYCRQHNIPYEGNDESGIFTVEAIDRVTRKPVSLLMYNDGYEINQVGLIDVDIASKVDLD